MHHLFVSLYRHFHHLFPVFVTMLRRHRLLVVLPVFMVVLALSVRGSQLGGSLMTENVQGRPLGPFSHATQVMVADFQAILAPGAIIDQQVDQLPRLTEGSLLVQSNGLIELDAGNFSVLGLSGGFSISIQKDTVTIAALTTPVLVADGAARMLIPVRSQWKSHGLASYKDALDTWLQARALKSLPVSYIEDQIALLKTLPSISSALHSSADDRLTTMLHFLRLPSSRMRAENQESVAEVSSLLERLQSGHKDDVLSLVQRGAVAGLLASSPAKPLLPVLLEHAAEQGMTAWFLPAFLSDEDRLLLASVHPQLSANAWTVETDVTVTTEGTLLRILMLPASDILPTGGSDLAIERWGETLKAFLHDQKDPQSLLTHLLPALETSIAHTDTLGYPLRAKHYAGAAIAATSKWHEHLSSEAKKALSDLEALDRRPQPPMESVPASSSAQSSSIASAAQSSVALLSDDDLRARTQVALEEAGALFTSRTEIIPIEGRNAVHISNIAFATAKGDLLVEFSYDVDRGIVFNVIQDGVPLPYDVPLAGYIEWLGRAQ